MALLTDQLLLFTPLLYKDGVELGENSSDIGNVSSESMSYTFILASGYCGNVNEVNKRDSVRNTNLLHAARQGSP